MNPLLLSGFGTSINVDKRKLIIQNKLKNEKLEFYPHQISHDSIIIDGHTGNITFEAMRWLMKHNIHLTMLNWNGNLLGVTLPDETKMGNLRIKQYQNYLENSARFEIASKIAESKFASSQNLVRELAKYHSVIDFKKFQRSLEKELKFYMEFLKDAENRSTKRLLEFEGRIAIIYLAQLSKIFHKLYPEFHFEGRKGKRSSWNTNAPDEINALLNYGYAVLESEVKRAINSVGLDPNISFLHEIKPGRASLVYDIQELYRWIVDLSVIQLLEEKKLRKSDFIITENYHVRLKEKTAKMLIEKIKLNFNRKVSYNNKKYSYQTILVDAIKQLANFIYGKKDKFYFEIPQIKIEREDTVDIKEKILKMSPEDRRKLGINKSTLWYMKKNLASGKNIKIYDKTFSKIKFKT